MTKKLAYGLVIAFVCLAIAGLVLGAVVLHRQADSENRITLSGNGITQDELSVSIGGLYPGKSAEYTVRFSGGAGAYAVEMLFRADGDAALAAYLTLEIELNGAAVSSGLLESYLGGDAVAFSLSADEAAGSVLTLRYTMPASVGNEAQDAAAEFVIEIQASPEG